VSAGCIGCDQLFVSVESFDTHRAGDGAERRCLLFGTIVGWERTKNGGWRSPKAAREAVQRAVSRGRQAGVMRIL
jgi:hypothetical protein